MKRVAVCLVAFNFLSAGCHAPRSVYIPPDTAEAYFDSLPEVTQPPSPYADPEKTRWYSIGYREGWQRGNSGVNMHPDPWYPQHQQIASREDMREPHRKGFDAGYGAGFQEAQRRLRRLLEEIGPHR